MPIDDKWQEILHKDYPKEEILHKRLVYEFFDMITRESISGRLVSVVGAETAESTPWATDEDFFRSAGLQNAARRWNNANPEGFQAALDAARAEVKRKVEEGEGKGADLSGAETLYLGYLVTHEQYPKGNENRAMAFEALYYVAKHFLDSDNREMLQYEFVKYLKTIDKPHLTFWDVMEF